MRITIVIHPIKPRNRHGRIIRRLYKEILKLKAKASGYHEWVHNPEDEERYVEKFWASESISLEKEAIRFNTAKLGMSKHYLNSM